MSPVRTNILGILFLTMLTATMGHHVAVFMPCVGSHIRAHLGIIRELIHQNHTVTSVVHQDCHKYFDTFRSNHILLHNYGLVKLTPEMQANIIIALDTLFNENVELHEGVVKYFQENQIDAILSSIFVQSSCQIAEYSNIPLLYNMYAINVAPGEKCPGCTYAKTTSIPSPMNSIDPSLFGTIANMYLMHILTVTNYPALTLINFERRKLGLKEISLKLSLEYNFARFPMVCQTYYPLVHPSVHLQDGRWMVGHIPAEEPRKEPFSDEYSTFLKDPSLPVIFIAFGTLAQLQNEELASLYKQITTQDVYKVIWSLKTNKQQQLSQLLQFENLEEFQSKLPSHIKLVHFAPQVQLLDSGFVKLFVSHGGYSSVLESIDAGVPLILHPVFGDQFYNSNVMQDIGCGIVMKNLDDLHEQVLAMMEGYERYESCIEKARERMSETGGAPQVVSILERLCEHGYEGMSFEYLMDGVHDFYSSLFILVATLVLPILLIGGTCCVCCCRKKRREEGKRKTE